MNKVEIPNKKISTASSNALTSLVAGIGSLFFATFPLAIIALITGAFALKERGKYLSKQKKIMAWAGILIAIIVIIFGLISLVPEILKMARS